jgi:hypothetical protein
MQLVCYRCGEAQLIACRFALKQARVQFSARHYPNESSGDEGMEEGPLGMVTDKCTVLYRTNATE